LVNVGSLASKVAPPYMGAYPASKFALAAYTQQLRLELGNRGLHVLLVCPGPIAREDAGQRYFAAAKDIPAEALKPGVGAKLKLIDPNGLAVQIFKACERRQPELVVPGKAKLLFALAQLWPALGDRYLRRSLK
jgi:short-subunit dehydrogenase